MKKIFLILLLLLIPIASGYSYHQTHDIVGNPNWASNQTDLTISINISNSVGSSGNGTVYLSGHSNNFPNDIQIKDNSNNILSYWIQSETLTRDFAKIWVKIPTISKLTNTTIHIYYGANDNDWKSSINQTFIFGDEFGVILEPASVNPIIASTGESDIIFDPINNKLDMWYSTNVAMASRTIYYKNTSNSNMQNDWSSPIVTDIPTGTVFPFIMLDNNKYYLFGLNSSNGKIYLWNSTDKIHWQKMNNNNPVLSNSSNPDDNNFLLFNPAVSNVDGTWHMLIEMKNYSQAGTEQGIGYTYSNINDMNWTTHLSGTKVISYAGNPDLFYISNKSALMTLHGKITNGVWDIRSSYAILGTDLTKSSSWLENKGFAKSSLASSIHITDPSLTITNYNKNYNIAISYLYNQESTYITFSNLSIDNFFELSRLTGIDSTKWSITGTPYINSGNLFTSNDRKLISSNAYDNSYQYNIRVFSQIATKSPKIGLASSLTAYDYVLYGNYPSSGYVNFFQGTTGTNLNHDGSQPKIYQFWRLGTNCTLYQDGVYKAIINGGTTNSLYAIFSGDGSIPYGETTWAFFRKWVYNLEPIQLSWSGELSETVLPITQFSANITAGNPPLSVQFTDSSLNSPTSWNYTFGDGNYSNLQNPTHTYVSVGNYTVSLNATNAAGSNTTTKTAYIIVSPLETPTPTPTPTATATATPTANGTPVINQSAIYSDIIELNLSAKYVSTTSIWWTWNKSHQYPITYIYVDTVGHNVHLIDLFLDGNWTISSLEPDSFHSLTVVYNGSYITNNSYTLSNFQKEANASSYILNTFLLKIIFVFIVVIFIVIYMLYNGYLWLVIALIADIFNLINFISSGEKELFWMYLYCLLLFIIGIISIRSK